MRKLTFKGFLSAYIKELSEAKTVNLAVLAAEVNAGNHRLAAPLLLYAVEHQKSEALRRQLAACGAGAELKEQLKLLEGMNLADLLQGNTLPEEYRKVWNSFCVRRDAAAHEEELKSAMRRKILRLMQDKGCSKYRIYTDLKLNPGNINAWLKDGDNKKVSYRTAEKIVAYVAQYRKEAALIAAP